MKFVRRPKQEWHANGNWEDDLRQRWLKSSVPTLTKTNMLLSSLGLKFLQRWAERCVFYPRRSICQLCEGLRVLPSISQDLWLRLQHYESAKGRTIVTSHVIDLNSFHGTNEGSSGRLPFDLVNPWGYLVQWSFRKIGTMGTLGPKDRSSRPEGPRAGVGFLGRGLAGRGQRAPSPPARGYRGWL